MSHPENPEDWQPWIEQACHAVGVDPALVDLDAVLALTRTVAQQFVRPMAPVAAHILGLAIGSQGVAERDHLIEDLVRTLPPSTQ
ncbi:MAG: molybdopterin-guanine dinucleotide biosynthesis protein A [Actinobacteria bacterium]|nr:molybdopterin-guanine dinucleotide biosynthesis protein A [Actinomycetota bacterium]